MTTRTQHTPVPWWATVPCGENDRVPSLHVYADKEGKRPIACCDWQEMPRLPHHEASANTAFIVRACNAHDDLVAALKAYLRIADYDGTLDHIQLLDMLEPVAEQARAALAKAAKD